MPSFGDLREASRLRSETCSAVGAVMTDSADDTTAAPPAVWRLFRVLGRELSLSP